MAMIAMALSKINLVRFSPSPYSSSRSSLNPARCSPIQQVQVDPTISCEPCNDIGWIMCPFCEGQKTNVNAENNRIYRRCPSCRAVGYVLCSKCKVFKCVTFPNYSDGNKRAMSRHSTSWMLAEGLCLAASIFKPQWNLRWQRLLNKIAKKFHLAG